MHIVIEADSIAVDKMSGIGHTTLEILQVFNRKVDGTNHKVSAIVPYGRKKFVSKYNLKNIKVRQLPPGYKYANYLLVRTSLPVPVDLIFGRGVYIFPNYKNWYVPFSRSLTFVHDVAFKLFPETTHPKNLVYLNANFNRWLKRTDRVITISNQSAREIEHFFPSTVNRISVVNLGVDKSVFYPRTETEIESALTRYGVSKDFFLAVGNIEPRKNIEALLDAYRIYVDSSDAEAAQLVLVGGDGWKNDSILKKIEKMRSEGYDVYRPNAYVQDADLPMLYSGSRALLHVALHEGFGLPPVEAQACGTPVIVSDIPVLREIVNESFAVFVDQNSPNAIANAMQQIKPMRANERRPHSNEKLTWDNTVEQLLSLAGIMKS